MKATTTYIFVMMCFSVGDGLSFMGKTIIIIVFRWLHAASTHLFAGSSQIKYVLRSPVCRCSVSCANIYSISSHPTWHMCASSLAMRCHATIVQSNLRLWKFTAFFLCSSRSPFSCVSVEVRRRYLPFDNVNLQRFTAEITLYCVPSVCRSFQTLILVRVWQHACRHSSRAAAWPMA